MAEQEGISQEDRTEEATPERRDEFRERGQVAVSREITSVFVLASCVIFLTFYTPTLINNLSKLFVSHFEALRDRKLEKANILNFAFATWAEVLYVVIPLFLVTIFIACGATFAQTRFNWSWKRLQPDFSRLNALKGIARMVSGQALVELGKGVGKMSAVGIVAYLILFSEWVRVPGLMNYSIFASMSYWGEITQYLFWAVSALLLLVAALDYFYNFVTIERKMKMTRQEVKEEFKRREVDPHVKARMRRIQRDLVTRRTLEKTEDATVLITNPTHYSVALKYELGMDAPKVIAKGVDFLALRMRERALDKDIPIIENRPLARQLYDTVGEGEEIPDSLYKAVAEIIRYVFKLKGKALAQPTPA